MYNQMGDKRLVYGEISNKCKNGKEEMKHKEQGIYVGLMGPASVDLPRGKNLIPFHQSRPLFFSQSTSKTLFIWQFHIFLLPASVITLTLTCSLIVT